MGRLVWRFFQLDVLWQQHLDRSRRRGVGVHVVLRASEHTERYIGIRAKRGSAREGWKHWLGRDVWGELLRYLELPPALGPLSQRYDTNHLAPVRRSVSRTRTIQRHCGLHPPPEGPKFDG